MPAYLYSLETVALTERQQTLQVCKNNWVRRITGAKKVDKRTTDELRGGDWCADEFDREIVEMLAELGWTLGADVGRENGRVDRMREQGRRERGRPWLRWEDCAMRDICKVDWRELDGDRGRWRIIVVKIGPHSL